MADTTLEIRPAALAESDTVAAIARTSRAHFLPYLPKLHSFEEDKSFYRNRVFADCAVWVAADGDTLAGFCAFKDDWVEHLYLLPTHVGRGLGPRLLGVAKERHGFLQLWVFQQNTRAMRFYARNGFAVIRQTDGQDNEERLPDALMAWHRGR